MSTNLEQSKQSEIPPSPTEIKKEPSVGKRIRAVLSTLNRYPVHYATSTRSLFGLPPFGEDELLPDTRGWWGRNFVPRNIDLAVEAWKTGEIQSNLINPPVEEDLGPDPRPKLRKMFIAREADTKWFEDHPQAQPTVEDTKVTSK